MPENDDMFRREEDMKNLAKIPVIEFQMTQISETLVEIKKNTDGFIGVKTDVDWLKQWHNWIVGGVLTSILAAIVVGVISFIKR